MYVLYVWYTLLLVLSRALPMYRNETRIKIMNNGSGVKDNHIRDLLYSMVYLYLAKHNETTQPCTVNTKEQQKKIEIFHLYSLWSSSSSSTSSSGKKRRIVCRENSINRSAVLTIRKKNYIWHVTYIALHNWYLQFLYQEKWSNQAEKDSFCELLYRKNLQYMNSNGLIKFEFSEEMYTCYLLFGMHWNFSRNNKVYRWN